MYTIHVYAGSGLAWHLCIQAKHNRYLSRRFCRMRIYERETVSSLWHTGLAAEPVFARQHGGLATSSGQRSDRCLCRVLLPSAAVRSVRTRLLSAERQQGGALLPTGTGRNLGPPRPNEAQRAGQQLEGQKPPIVVGRQLEAYVCVRPAHPSRS